MSFKLTPVDELPPAVREKDQAVANLLHDFEASRSRQSKVEEFEDRDLSDLREIRRLKGQIERTAKKVGAPVAVVVRSGFLYLVRTDDGAELGAAATQ